MQSRPCNLNPALLASQAEEAHERTLQLLEGLSETQLMGPRLATVNPLRWEVGHAAYFYEYWVLRQHLGRAAIRADADSLYDSISISHDQRWDLPLPGIEETLDYMRTVLDQVKACLAEGDDSVRDYLAQYAVFHQDMHNEAYTYTRQTLGYPAPRFSKPVSHPNDASGRPQDGTGRLSGDAQIPGGRFMLGAAAEEGFVFDNEKWAHPVEIAPFGIARAAVSNADYLAFVEAGGYDDKAFWSEAGWAWRQHAGLHHPVYWRHGADTGSAGGWQLRQFDQWVELPLNAAVIHVSWYEAQAYCRWAGRRLPTEAEWEVAAAAQPTDDGLALSATKRRFPWGDHMPQVTPANLDGYALGSVDVAAYAAGDSAFGCRQMIGNVWEWTQSTFAPYPGFVPDMYADYSQPLFGNTKVLRGGGWATPARMIRNSWRTYYGPERNDVFAGFRTCSL